MSYVGQGRWAAARRYVIYTAKGIPGRTASRQEQLPQAKAMVPYSVPRPVLVLRPRIYSVKERLDPQEEGACYTAACIHGNTYPSAKGPVALGLGNCAGGRG